ncbi:MAG: DASS family sodium-coupled anion symporter [Nitrospirae bacterium]|nr:DASS family sodium-coupled anion symporter [Nitrospirota bacterium]
MEKISPAEERFERWRQTVGVVAGPAVFLLLILLPTPSLTTEAHRLAAVMGLVLIYWVTEAIPIPVTAVLGPVLCVLLGVAPAKQVLAPFGDPIVFLFIGSFLIARAMTLYQLDRRFALALFSLPGMGNNLLGVFLVCGTASVLISMWITNTSTTAMMLPIALGILNAVGDLAPRTVGESVPIHRTPYATGLMLMIAFGASIGGIGTPVGTAPNLIGIGMIESMVHVKIGFLHWMMLAVPILTVMFAILIILLRRLHPPPLLTLDGAERKIIKMRQSLGGWTRGQVCSLIAFATAVFLWILPGLFMAVLGGDHPWTQFLDDRLNEGVVALMAASLLFFLPVDWKRRTYALSWKEGVQIDGGTILLFGGGLSLGKLMLETKLAETLGHTLMDATGLQGVWGITALAIVFAIIVSETTSNTASASMVVPVMIALAQSAGVSPIPPALGATLGASFGFMLPVSTPPNAIIYGSGLVSIRAMIRAGIWFDILGGLILWAGLRILCPIMGWAE